MVRRFEDLRVWEEAMDLVELIYNVSESFPKSEVYGLTNQIRRAAVNVASNISEGCGMATEKSFVNYLHNALGSAKEVKCQLIIAVRLKFLGKQKGEEVIDVSDKVIGMVMRFINRVSVGEVKDEI